MPLNIGKFLADMHCYKINIFFFFLLSTFSITNAQIEAPVDLQLSESFNIPSKTALDRIISADGENAYFLRRSYSIGGNLTNVIVERYDVKTLRLKKAIDISLKYQKKLRVFHDIIKVGEKYFLITSFFNSVKNKNYLFAQNLDSGFNPDDNLILIGEIDSRNEAQSGDFQIQHSRDSSKVIIYQDLPTKRSERQTAKINIYDSNFDLLWEKSIRLPYESRLYTSIKFEVDNNGNAYLLGKRFFEKTKDVVKNRPNFEYILEAYTQLGEKVDRYQLNDKLKLITDLTFEVSNKSEIICTGFYTNKVKSSGNFGISESIQGIVYFKIDNIEKKVEEKTFSEFDLDFITINENDYRKRQALRKNEDGNLRNDPALYSYDFRDVILRSDGGVVIIAEQFYIEEINRSPNGFNQGFNNRTFQSVSIYNYNEVIVVNIRPDGSIQWANSVPKYQSAQSAASRRFLSFANANVGDKIYLVFNEDPKILGANKNSLFNSRDALALAEINKKGEISIFEAASTDELKSVVIPTVTKQIARKELLIYSVDKNKFRIGRLKLK